jgi:TusA-related sulfurtransferase
MPQEIKSDQKLNLEGLLCPIPIVKVRDRKSVV